MPDYTFIQGQAKNNLYKIDTNQERDAAHLHLLCYRVGKKLSQNLLNLILLYYQGRDQETLSGSLAINVCKFNWFIRPSSYLILDTTLHMKQC
jgi:hypothetical protein